MPSPNPAIVPAHVGTGAPARPAGHCSAKDSPAARSITDVLVPALIALLILCAAPLLSASDCIALGEASHHVGETKCVMGKVLRVKTGARGVHFLDFCPDQMACPFTVVVFPRDLKDVGDVRRLAGHLIEIRGPVKLYDGRAEIILNRVSQITGGSTLIPPLPKNYDVENRGHYSAGHLYHAKKPAKTTASPNTTATYGNEADSSEPQ
jgi:hypothetical protein